MKKLRKDKYCLVGTLLNKVDFNCLFAEVVINQWVEGEVYVNDEQNPTASYIIHPYGMSLLLGESGNTDFNNQVFDSILRGNNISLQTKWLLGSDEMWNVLIRKHLVNSDSLDKSINEGVRLNFKYKRPDNKINYQINSEYQVRQTAITDFNQINGSVIPKYFYLNENEFQQKGIAFSVYKNDIPVSTAFAACIYNDKIEIGIETNKEYRGMGLAKKACEALIDYAVENEMEPVWSCVKTNTSSFRLAQSLGFNLLLERPYFIVNSKN